MLWLVFKLDFCNFLFLFLSKTTKIVWNLYVTIGFNLEKFWTLIAFSPNNTLLLVFPVRKFNPNYSLFDQQYLKFKILWFQLREVEKFIEYPVFLNGENWDLIQNAFELSFHLYHSRTSWRQRKKAKWYQRMVRKSCG